MWRETVTLDRPYNFEQVLQRLALNPLNAADIATNTIKVPVWQDGRPVVATVQGTGTFEAPQFLVSASENVRERVSEIFGWSTEMAEVHRHFAATSLQPLFERFAHTPLVLEFDYFDCLTRCIIHQQLNLKFAFTLTDRFVKQYGFEQEGVWFGPTPERTAAIPIEELRELQFSQRKAEYLTGLAQHIVSGKLDLEELRHLSDEEVAKRLLPLRGIGPWTVENFLMFALGRPNLFPKADIGIQRAVQQLFGLEQKPDQAFLAKLQEEYNPYGSYASLYLWRSIE
ncbi:DNA-3-methyladenine glycosylase family protein [Ectobacillus ponti]|uniref:DNA-3-methyladenine glycosylase II n=1 Tax=Ectobacillus ponti TaxID=2961894 RepID=A0AA41X6V5_9BACI|nr:DNA-3-methyladenine glycosylase [Ectobacillus ponti]MCP8969917.1 DNA-3-methyladenine glycosylase [Ectobacillus ponti]